MRVSLINIADQLIFQKNKTDLFTKFIFFNRSLNASFSGNIDDMVLHYLADHLDSFDELNELLSKLSNITAKKDSADLIHLDHFSYLRNLMILSFMQNIDDDELENTVKNFDITDEKNQINSYWGEIIENDIMQNFDSFSNDLEDFFSEEFIEKLEKSFSFLMKFRHFESREQMEIDERLPGFFQNFMKQIVHVIFSDASKAEVNNELLLKFENIIFKNRFFEKDDSKIERDPNDSNEISFMTSLFHAPYQKMLKLKKIFDLENEKSDSERNDAFIISAVMLASQFGIYHTHYSAKLLLKLVEDNLNLAGLGKTQISSNETLLLSKWKKILSNFSSALMNSSWSHGLLKLIEKIGVETEEVNDEIEKLYRLLDLEIVKITHIQKHPSSETLNLCKLSNGKEVVCGASNVHFIKDNNFCAIYAPLGSYLPNDMLISPREIRGVISRGMLCSFEELKANGYNLKPAVEFKLVPLNAGFEDEIMLNNSKEYSGIAILKDENDRGSAESENSLKNSFIGRYFNMHTWADLSLTPNLGYLIGEMNLISEIEKFICFVPNKNEIYKELRNYLKSYNEYLSDSKISLKNKINTFNFKEILHATSFEENIILAPDVAKSLKNVISFKTSLSKIKFDRYFFDQMDVLCKNFDPKSENKIEILAKYFAGLYGIQFHCICLDNIDKKIIIKHAIEDEKVKIHPFSFSHKSCAEINVLKGDLAAYDQKDSLIFIPGVSNSFEFCASLDQNLQKDSEVLFIGFLFGGNENTKLSSYLDQLKLGCREKINNDFVHFYQRQNAFDLQLFLDFCGSEVNEFIALADKKYLDHDFKEIAFNQNDLLALFKKDAMMVHGMMRRSAENAYLENFMKLAAAAEADAEVSADEDQADFFAANNDSIYKEKIASFFEYLYTNFIQQEFDSLGFKFDSKDFNSKDFLEEGLKVFVPTYRTDINSSVDLIAILYKILNANSKISVTNDNMSAYFEDAENLDQEVMNFSNRSDAQYDENLKITSFEIQAQNQNIPLAHEGENSLMDALYSAFKKLCCLGYSEVYHFSFINELFLRDIVDKENLVHLSSTVNKTLNVLRPNLLCGLLEKYKEIIKTGCESVALFEHGPVFWKQNIFLHHLSGIRGGKKFSKNIHLPIKLIENYNFFDYFDIKADVLKVLSICNLNEDNLEFISLDEFYDYKNRDKFQKYQEGLLKNGIILHDKKNDELTDINEKFFHPLKTALIFAKNHNEKSSGGSILLGYCGQLSPLFLEKFDLLDEGHEKISGFIIFKESFAHFYKNRNLYMRDVFVSEFQPVFRDFSLVFDEEITISEIKKNILKNVSDSSKLKSVFHDLKFFDIFQNEELKKQKKKSVGFSFKLWSKEKTLNDKEIKEMTNIILEKIKEDLGGVFAFDM